MKFSVLVIFSLVCGCFGNPLNSTALSDRQARELDIVANTRNLVNELITNMGEAANQANEAIEKFRAGLEEQANLFEERVRKEFDNFRVSVEEFAQNVADRANDLGQEVNTCIATNLQAAEKLYSKSLDDLLKCGRDLIDDVGEQITSLLRLTDNATDFSRRTLDELRECYSGTSPTDILTLGRCVGSLAVQAELEATGYFAQSAYLIGRINLAFFTLPAGLQTCAGSQLFEAGRYTAITFNDIMTCSANAVSNVFTQNNNNLESGTVTVTESIF